MCRRCQLVRGSAIAWNESCEIERYWLVLRWWARLNPGADQLACMTRDAHAHRIGESLMIHSRFSCACHSPARVTSRTFSDDES